MIFFGKRVRCETENGEVCLNDLVIAGNAWRHVNGLSSRKLSDITQTDSFKNFIKAASRVENIPEERQFHTTGRGRTSRTMGRLVVAIYVAEQMSPDFHVQVIRTFVEGKLLEFRDFGGTEFKSLNAAIDAYLPGRDGKDGKDNKGVYINVAKKLREKILGEGATTESWNRANVQQTHVRYEYENKLCFSLSMGFVKDFEHLKGLIDKL